MDRLDFAKTVVFVAGGKVHDDPSNELALVAWMAEENSRALWNPFDTTWPYPGATDYNSVGVKNYMTVKDGLNAFFLTLQRGPYQSVVKALSEGDCACAVVEAVANSPWGTWRGDPVGAVRFMLEVRADYGAYCSVNIAP